MLLILTTTLRRIMVPVALFFVWTPAAHAWSWPVQGPVLQPFSYDAAHPYASGQHRGIDIGADATGQAVGAPAAGTVTFAGTVPTSGQSVTIETQDGYSVTLTHLGSIAVAKGATVAEGEEVGTIGPSGTPEVAGPYVHLGVRVEADPNGYVDPLGLLPGVAETGGNDSGSATTQPSASGGSSSSAAPAAAPASAAATTTPATAAAQAPATRGSARVERRRAPVATAEGRPQHLARRPSLPQSTQTESRARRRPRTPHRRVSVPVYASRRPVVEAAIPHESTDLGAGHEPEQRTPSTQLQSPQRRPPNQLLALAVNGAATMVALAAALAAARRRRRDVTNGVAHAQVIRLPRPVPDRHLRRAA